MDDSISKVLTIAGSDCSGGAGIQADLRTFASLGCFGMSVLTAVTAQNTRGVQSIHALPSRMVRNQLESVLQDLGCNAVKTGMLFDGQIIDTVSQALIEHQIDKLVVDPVLTAKDGSALMQAEAINSIKSRLFPVAMLVTPNIPEAEIFLDRRIADEDDMESAAIDFLSFGCQAVLLKGGHLLGRSSADCFVWDDAGVKVEWLREARVETNNTHGTGCTLSAAITSHLAKGLPLIESVIEGKRFVSAALSTSRSYRLGSGHGPVYPLAPVKFPLSGAARGH